MTLITHWNTYTNGLPEGGIGIEGTLISNMASLEGTHIKTGVVQGLDGAGFQTLYHDVCYLGKPAESQAHPLTIGQLQQKLALSVATKEPQVTRIADDWVATQQGIIANSRLIKMPVTNLPFDDKRFFIVLGRINTDIIVGDCTINIGDIGDISDITKLLKKRNIEIWALGQQEGFNHEACGAFSPAKRMLLNSLPDFTSQNNRSAVNAEINESGFRYS